MHMNAQLLLNSYGPKNQCVRTFFPYSHPDFSSLVLTKTTIYTRGPLYILLPKGTGFLCLAMSRANCELSVNMSRASSINLQQNIFAIPQCL